MVDLRGYVFGSLEVLYVKDRPGERGTVVCACVCGKAVEVFETMLEGVRGERCQCALLRSRMRRQPTGRQVRWAA